MSKSPSGRLHGTYIHDFPAFRMVREVTRDEARSLLERSPFVAREDYDASAPYMFLNKGFFVVKHHGDTVVALYLVDRNYYVHEAPTTEALRQMSVVRELMGRSALTLDALRVKETTDA